MGAGVRGCYLMVWMGVLVYVGFECCRGVYFSASSVCGFGWVLLRFDLVMALDGASFYFGMFLGFPGALRELLVLIKVFWIFWVLIVVGLL